MAPCKEEIYLKFPGRYRLPRGKCFKCRSYVYGLKQSAARWHELFSTWLKDYGFENLDEDGVTFIKRQRDQHGTESKIVLSMHVDDGLAASNDPVMYAAFLDALCKDFELSDCGELSWLLGCKVEQDRQTVTVRLTQEKYCNDVLKRFQMHDCTPVSTPCEANMHLSDSDCPPLHGITYRRDATDAAAAAMGKRVGPNQITASADADHAGAKDRRSVSGYAIMLAGAMVMWTSKRQ